jgi:DNA polymerase-3 subunit epsilon
MSREVIVVDIETTSLDRKTCAVLEVAALNPVTQELLYFVPFVTPGAIAAADFAALQVNRYFERGAWRAMLDPQTTEREYTRLTNMLENCTFAGSNPSFDAEVLKRFVSERWHHRLADLSAYAAPAMNRDPGDLPGLNLVCEFLDVTNEVEHGAAGDVRATADCFAKLKMIYSPSLPSGLRPGDI